MLEHCGGLFDYRLAVDACLVREARGCLCIWEHSTYLGPGYLISSLRRRLGVDDEIPHIHADLIDLSLLQQLCALYILEQVFSCSI